MSIISIKVGYTYCSTSSNILGTQIKALEERID